MFWSLASRACSLPSGQYVGLCSRDPEGLGVHDQSAAGWATAWRGRSDSVTHQQNFYLLQREWEINYLGLFSSSVGQTGDGSDRDHAVHHPSGCRVPSSCGQRHGQEGKTWCHTHRPALEDRSLLSHVTCYTLFSILTLSGFRFWQRRRRRLSLMTGREWLSSSL